PFVKKADRGCYLLAMDTQFLGNNHFVYHPFNKKSKLKKESCRMQPTAFTSICCNVIRRFWFPHRKQDLWCLPQWFLAAMPQFHPEQNDPGIRRYNALLPNWVAVPGY